MSPLLLFGMVFFSSASPTHYGRPLHARTETIAGWRLKISEDGFSGQVHCTIKRHDVSVSPTAISFDLGDHVDTTQITVRVDDGAPQFFHSTYESLPPNHPGVSLFNPSGGRVLLPLGIAAHGRRIAVETSPKARVAVFDLTGLREALSAAQAKCADF